jgi:hypothetical protein
MRRQKRLVILAALALVLTAWSFAVMPPRYYVSGSDFEKVHVGMSRRQVEDLLGPPGDYRTARTLLDLDTVNYELETSLTPAGWVGDHWLWVVGFDDDDRVMQRLMWDANPVPQGRSENLIWRTKRQWYRWFP